MKRFRVFVKLKLLIIAVLFHINLICVIHCYDNNFKRSRMESESLLLTGNVRDKILIVFSTDAKISEFELKRKFANFVNLFELKHNKIDEDRIYFEHWKGKYD